MRKVGWTLGVIGFLALCLTVAALRKEPDPYREFRPYIVHDNTDYQPERVYRPFPSTKMTVPARSIRTIVVRGGDQSKLLALLTARAKSAGLTPSIHRGVGVDFFVADKAAPIAGRGLSFGEQIVGQGRATSSSGFSISEVHELSKWDIFLYRVKHAGQSPFGESLSQK